MPIDKAERTDATGGRGGCGGDVERVAEWLCVYTGHLHLDQDKSSMSYNTVDELTALAAEVSIAAWTHKGAKKCLSVCLCVCVCPSCLSSL